MSLTVVTSFAFMFKTRNLSITGAERNEEKKRAERRRSTDRQEEEEEKEKIHDDVI